ncbi:MAG: DUF190 domain-containing protein [bacterium]|jgi:PII-like signaling protein
MQPDSEAKLLRIFIGEGDRYHHSSLHEVIVRKSQEAGLAGATVLRGLMSYGTSGKLRSTRILDLSADLPVVVEIVDKAEKITAFLPLLDQLLTEAECGGLVTLETVQIISYQRGKT